MILARGLRCQCPCSNSASTSASHSVVSDSLRLHGLYIPWNSPGQNTGVDSLSLLQKIFPTQGLNPGLLYSRWILYQLSHQGSTRILEWVAYPFARASSRPRNRTGSPALQADSLPTELPGEPTKVLNVHKDEQSLSPSTLQDFL